MTRLLLIEDEPGLRLALRSDVTQGLRLLIS